MRTDFILITGYAGNKSDRDSEKGNRMTEKIALLVVDVQVSMFADLEPPFHSQELLANIRLLIDRAKSAGVDVIYVRHAHARYEPMMFGADGWQIHPSIAPEPGDVIVDKRACDAFHGTSLQSTITNAGIGHLIVTGMQTELCVDTVCRSALHRDLNVTLVSDAHSTWDRKGMGAEQIIEHHNSTLADVPHPSKDIFVKPTSEIAFA